jgi:hypothetical protein
MCVLLAAVVCGCANIRVTNPPRTATEQFLLSHAATQAIDKFSFEALFGRKVYVDSTHFAPSEKEFVLGEFRSALFEGGVQVLEESEKAEIIVEVRSGGIGIDRYENLVGIPALAAPAGAGAAGGGPEGAALSTLITPEVAITKNIRQLAFANVSYVAYWKETGEIVARAGPEEGRAFREDWWLLGMGPKTVGDIMPARRKTE